MDDSMDSSSSSSNQAIDENPPYDEYDVIDKQMKFLIMEDLSFLIFKYDSWTNFCKLLQPKYKKVSISTIKRHAFKHYFHAKKHLINYFDRFQNKVTLTIRIWKSSYYTICSYISIICHWIDPQTWKPSNRIIGLQIFDSPLDSREIYEFIVSCTCEYNLQDKILSVCVYEEESGVYSQVIEMVKRELNPVFNGDFFRTKCVCYVLNTMVKSCLDFVANVISKFQEMVDYVYESPKRNKFHKFLYYKGVKFSEPCIHFPEKWNTTYKMLGFILKQKPLLVEFYTKCGKKNIEEKDWETIESLLGILEVFHGSTKLLSDAYSPTIPLVLGEILLISNMFKNYKQNPFWEPLISKLQSKFLRFYEKMAPIYYCGAVLNPTLGVGGVENILEDIEANLGLVNSSNIEKCKETLLEVFDYYDKKHNKSRTQELVPFVGSSARSKTIRESVLRKKAKNIGNEMELYKMTDFSNLMSLEESESFNVLEWWRNKGCIQYPVLAIMACDILTIQASSVALQYAFCLNGRILGEKLSRLSIPMFQMRIFLKEYFQTNGLHQSVNLVEEGDSEDGDEEEDEDEDEDGDDYDYYRSEDEEEEKDDEDEEDDVPDFTQESDSD